MSFDAYIRNIQTKTGKTPEDFRALANKQGLLGSDVKAMKIVSWLKRISASVMATQWRFGAPFRRTAGSKRSDH